MDRAALSFGKDAFPQYAGTRQRIAQVLAENDRLACIDHVVAKHGASERFACRVFGQHRSTQSKITTARDDKPALTAVALALSTAAAAIGV